MNVVAGSGRSPSVPAWKVRLPAAANVVVNEDSILLTWISAPGAPAAVVSVLIDLLMGAPSKDAYIDTTVVPCVSPACIRHVILISYSPGVSMWRDVGVEPVKDQPLKALLSVKLITKGAAGLYTGTLYSSPEAGSIGTLYSVTVGLGKALSPGAPTGPVITSGGGRHCPLP